MSDAYYSFTVAYILLSCIYCTILLASAAVLSVVLTLIVSHIK